MMSSIVEIGKGSLLSLFGAWSKSTTAQLGLGCCRLNVRFSARVLGRGRPSQMREQAVVMPQKEGSSECDDPSELPSGGESLKVGWSNLFVRGLGFVVIGTPLHITAPLLCPGAAWREGFRVSTFSMGLILRRLLCGESKNINCWSLTASVLNLFSTSTHLSSHTFLFPGQRLCVSSGCSSSGPVSQRGRWFLTQSSNSYIWTGWLLLNP